jgi:hypothetical protein
MSKTKTMNIRDRLMGEYILLGGEIMSRGQAVSTLQDEGAPRQAIDWCVFAVPALTEEELLGFARNELLFQLRCRVLALGAIVE